MRKNKGFTLIEVLISITLLIFLFFAVFYAIGSVMSGSILTERKVELVDELDHRINEYVISGDFDASNDGNMTFTQEASVNNIIEFRAANGDFDLNVTKRVFENEVTTTGGDEDTDDHDSDDDSDSGSSKVVLCHKPGTSAEKTKTLPAAAVKGHLGHGDYYGPCRDNYDDSDDDEIDDDTQVDGSEIITICYKHNKNKWRTKSIERSELSNYEGAYEGNCV